MNRYFSMVTEGRKLTLNIMGDITSLPWLENDVSAKPIVEQLNGADVDEIDVHINSYGGEVAEGLAIYNALRNHRAKVVTYCDGFACSIASVIFMAGDERVMSDSSLLMIHNAWTIADGNAEQLRKAADDLEKITSASVAAYKAHSNLSEADIKALMDAESWILPDEATEYGFATKIEKTATEKASQNAKKALLAIVKAYRQKLAEMPKAEEGEEEPENPPKNSPETDEEPDTDKTDGEEETGEETGKESEKRATEKLSGFFNAILKN